MSVSDFNNQPYWTIACPVCGTRIVEQVHVQAHEARCPDCHTTVPVPAAADIPAAAERKPLPDVGTYRILYEAESVGKRRSKQGDRESQRTRAMVLVKCPLCAARIDTLAKQAPRAVKCPDCHEPVRIPSLAEVDSQRRKVKPKRSPASIEALPVRPPDGPRPAAPTYLADAVAYIRREEDSPPPRWTFFTRVFDVPWHPEVLSRWVYLSIGLTVMNLLITFMIEQGQETAGSRFGMVTAFFVLPLFWIAFWTLSYAAACCRAILEDTANGSDRITSWHEPNWREWVIVLTAAGFLLSLILIVAYFTARLVELAGGPNLLTFVAVTGTLFPLILLSSLEADSLILPWSGAVLRSLWRRWRGWALYYLLSTMTLAVPVLLVMYAASLPLPLPLLGSPLLAAAIFIVARLLGRLGWLISRGQPG